MQHLVPTKPATVTRAATSPVSRWWYATLLSVLMLTAPSAWAQTYLIGTNQTTCAGTLYDSGGPSANYANNENLTTVLTPATTGAKVAVTFTAFDLENNYDYLRVYNGPSATSTLLGTFTGNTNPGTLVATNATGQLTLVFTSDGSVTYTGFAATVFCANNVPSITSFSPASGLPGTSVVITGTNFTGSTAVSFNNVAATSFIVNSATQITATVPAGATSGPIRVTNTVQAVSSTNFTVPAPTVTSFTPTSGATGNVVVTGTGFLGATAVTIGGTTAPTFTVNSATQVTVTVPAGAFSGPICVTTPSGTGCSTGTYNTGNLAYLIGTNQTTCTGTIYDSGGPNGPYSNSENLTSVLTPGNGSKVVLTFSAFDLESSFDFLRIYDGPSATSPLLGTFSGTTIPGPITASAANTTGQLTLVFTSDASVTHAGFAAAISCLAPPTCTPVTALTVSNVTATSATLNFTPGIGNNSYIVTYTPANGTAQTTTGTASPINLTNLVPSTAYTVTVQPVCTVGTSPNTITTATFTTLLLNDEPCGAVTLSASPTAGSNVRATTSVQNGINTPACGGGPLPKDVWFAFTPTSSRALLTLTGTAAGTVRVFSSPNCTSGPFAEVFCQGSGANNTAFTAPVSVTGLTAGTRYYVAVNGYGASDTQGPFTIAFTNVLATRAQAESDALLVYPNPSNTGQLTLKLNGLLGTGQISLLNTLGQTVRRQPLTSTAEQILSTRDLAAGLYTLRVTVGEQVLTRKVVLE